MGLSDPVGAVLIVLCLEIVSRLDCFLEWDEMHSSSYYLVVVVMMWHEIEWGCQKYATYAIS